MRTWLVIYQTNTGFVYGWVCKGHSVSDAESEFWRAIEAGTGKTVLAVSELQSEVVDAYFTLYMDREVI